MQPNQASLLRMLSIHILAAVLVLAASPGRLTAEDDQDGPGNGTRAFSIAKIGPLPVHSGSHARSVNNAGEVAGTSGTVHAYVGWEGGLVPLPPLSGGTISRAEGITESGTVLGSSNSSIADDQAVFWTPHPSGRWSVTPLPTAPGDLFSLAQSMNAAGIVAGTSDDGYDWRAALWVPGDDSAGGYSITLLPMPDSDDKSAALDINDSGTAVGYSARAGYTRAALWTRARREWTLRVLPGLDHTDISAARAINAAGAVAGWAWSPASARRHATVWINGALVDLGTLGAADSCANDINSRGDVVGELWDAGLGGGFLRLAGASSSLNLQTLLPANTPWKIRSATGINDQREIVGTGVIEGYVHSFIMSPVRIGPGDPEPDD